MNRSELKRQRKIDGIKRGYILSEVSTTPYRQGYRSKMKAIRDIVEHIPDWVRESFDQIHQDSTGQHFVSRHGTNYRVDLLQTPGFNRAAKMAYTRSLQRANRRSRRGNPNPFIKMNAAVPA